MATQSWRYSKKLEQIITTGEDSAAESRIALSLTDRDSAGCASRQPLHAFESPFPPSDAAKAFKYLYMHLGSPAAARSCRGTTEAITALHHCH